jgi:hypothetical protein
MSKLIALSILAIAATASAQPGPDASSEPAPAPAPALPSPCCVTSPKVATATEEPAVPTAQPALAKPSDDEDDDNDTWHKPVGHRFLQGFRIGYTYLSHWDVKSASHDNMSLKDKFGLKTPNMMLIGYEGFYRIVGHSWLNVIIVGNATIAGLEQSKIIPAASGLIGFEFQKSFQVGVGVNLTPDPAAPSHMIAAAGWTPRVGGIYTPVHFFFVPDTEGNHRSGVTVGMTW